MRLERITGKSIGYGIEIQKELFPEESGRVNLEESLEEGSDYSYYLLYEGENCIGIIGLYSYPEDPESAWLGWFGIREAYRRKHFGTKALKAFEDLAVSTGYRYARLYTDEEDNDAALSFYRANGYVLEPYRNKDDPACLEYRTVIFSKSLTEKPLVPWGSRTIHLTEQIRKQEKYANG